MSRRRMLVIGAVVATLLVAGLVTVGGGMAIAQMRQAQARSTHQSPPATAPQRGNPGLLPLSGTPQATSAVTYQKWKLASFTFDGTPQPLGAKVTAVFITNAQGLEALGHVCNGYGETYTWSQDHAHLIARGAWQTNMLCTSNIMGLEANYLAALRQVTIYQAGQSEVTLRDDAGRYVMRYVPA